LGTTGRDILLRKGVEVELGGDHVPEGAPGRQGLVAGRLGQAGRHLLDVRLHQRI